MALFMGHGVYDVTASYHIQQFPDVVLFHQRPMDCTDALGVANWHFTMPNKSKLCILKNVAVKTSVRQIGTFLASNVALNFVVWQ